VAKKALKDQRKAERKARREKKNAELKALEQNGYQPSGAPLDYPEDLQNAQRKVGAQKAGNAQPASSQ
jgi:hypothetical protein